MDVVTSNAPTVAPILEELIKKTILRTDLINVETKHEALKGFNATLAPGTDVLEAVKQDPAVLEAQVSVGTANGQAASVSSTPAMSYVANASPRNGSASPDAGAFERMAGLQWQALQSLTPEQMALLLRYVSTLRRQRHALQRTLECAFCKNNGESLAWYSQHALKNWRGRVQCPVLRAFRCPRCGATGDRAHTIKYCPENNDTDRWSNSY